MGATYIRLRHMTGVVRPLQENNMLHENFDNQIQFIVWPRYFCVFHRYVLCVLPPFVVGRDEMVGTKYRKRSLVAKSEVVHSTENSSLEFETTIG